MSKTPLHDRLRESTTWQIVTALRKLVEDRYKREEALRRAVRDNPTGLDAQTERKFGLGQDHNHGRVR